MSRTTLGPRLRTRLHEWQAEGRISWGDFADVQADTISDTDFAIVQAIADEDFADAWAGRPMHSARARALHALLQPQPDDPKPIAAGWLASRELLLAGDVA